MKFDYLLEKYKSYHKSLCHSEKTIKNYVEILTIYNEVICIDDYYNMTYDDFQRYSDYLSTKSISVSSFGSYVRHVKAFIHWLGEYEYISDNLLYQKIRVPKQSKKNIKIYTEIEIKLIYEKCISCSEVLTLRNKLIISLMLDSGLRQNEVCKILYNDINFFDNTLVVHGKGRKDRLVPLGKVTLHYIVKYTLLMPPSDVLLLTRCGNPLTTNTVKLFVSKISKSLDFPFSSHKLRHNFATNYLLDQYEKYGQFDAYTLMILLGHEEISTTDRYIHLVKQHIATQKRVSHLDKVFLECENK